MNREEVRGWYRAKPGYWFRPKLFGLGAVPVTWQGWLSVLVLIAISVGIGWISETFGRIYLVLIAPVVLIFLWITWAKTDGSWRWRWGNTSRD